MPNPIVHFEIGSRDKARCKDFYTKLFDWKIEQMGPADMIRTGASADGKPIDGHFNQLGHEPHHYVTIYVQVDDIDATLKKAVELGGKMHVPKTDIGFGWFGWMSDLDGNIIGVYTPKNS